MELDESLRGLRGSCIEIGAKKEGFVSTLLEYAKLLTDEGDYTILLADV